MSFKISKQFGIVNNITQYISPMKAEFIATSCTRDGTIDQNIVSVQFAATEPNGFVIYAGTLATANLTDLYGSTATSVMNYSFQFNVVFDEPVVGIPIPVVSVKWKPVTSGSAVVMNTLASEIASSSTFVTVAYSTTIGGTSLLECNNLASNMFTQDVNGSTGVNFAIF